jgi:hypothetical protein
MLEEMVKLRQGDLLVLFYSSDTSGDNYQDTLKNLAPSFEQAAKRFGDLKI